MQLGVCREYVNFWQGLLATRIIMQVVKFFTRDYSNSGTADKGLLIEVPIHVATSHDTMRLAATIDFSALWLGSEIQIQPIYEVKRRKEFESGAAS